MPKNPYDFVRLPDRVDRLQVEGHDHFHDERGRLTCQLEVLTPLFIYHPGHIAQRRSVKSGKRPHEWAQFPVRGGRAWIPGSSLKGVIRSVAEAVSGSCLTLFDSEYERRQVHYNVPIEFRTCQKPQALCPTCRLFGMLNRGNVYLGNVMISDGEATASDYILGDYLTLIPLSTPKPRHSAFYQRPGQPNQARGRKFYLHHPKAANLVYFEPQPAQTDQNKTVQPVLPKSVFTFEVDYENVAAEDLRLLLYALSLTKEVRHKVGLGKPVGLGSVHIHIVRWERLGTGAARYRGSKSEMLGDGILQRRLDDELAQFRQAAPVGPLNDLERIWLYDHGQEVHYPDQDWFRRNPRTPLDKAW